MGRQLLKSHQLIMLYLSVYDERLLDQTVMAFSQVSQILFFYQEFPYSADHVYTLQNQI